MGNQSHSQEQLRGRIDSGRTGDKVPYPDPAMAPLGTDDEAAGSSSRLEPDTLGTADRRALEEPHRPQPGPHGTPGAGTAIWVAVLAGSLAAAAAIWLGLLG
jgi:hypothetical protein